MKIIIFVAAIISFTNAGLPDTYPEDDFEEFYTEPLSKIRYPDNAKSSPMQFDMK